jgi:hypothetical protein
MEICNCGREFKSATSLKSHARFCDKYEKKVKKTKYFKNNEYLCECGKTFNNSQSLNGHFSHCLVHRNGEPVNRKYPSKGSMNGWEKFNASEISDFHNKSKITLADRIESGVVKPSFLGKRHTNTTKQKISEKAIENSNGYIKCSYYEVYCLYRGCSINVQGTYEKKYAEYLNSENILWDRSRKINLKYKLHEDDYIHTYYPDFYLIDTDEYVEIKGYWWKSADGRVDDRRKMDSVITCNPNRKIKILESKELNELTKLV